ncbi:MULTISPECIES: hypothetical protein [unclassified Bradyrhizobium]|nr:MULTISPECIES: hypothetical protein [unclassified Bradyrhizobium]
MRGLTADLILGAPFELAATLILMTILRKNIPASGVLAQSMD